MLADQGGPQLRRQVTQGGQARVVGRLGPAKRERDPVRHDRHAPRPQPLQRGKKSGVSSSFLPEKMKEEIRCQFIILARKDEPTPDDAKK